MGAKTKRAIEWVCSHGPPRGLDAYTRRQLRKVHTRNRASWLQHGTIVDLYTLQALSELTAGQVRSGRCNKPRVRKPLVGCTSISCWSSAAVRRLGCPDFGRETLCESGSAAEGLAAARPSF